MPRKSSYTVTPLTEDVKPLEGELIPADKPGRPSLYKPEFCDTLLEMMSQGKTDTQVCAVLGISTDSLARYRRAHPELAEAYEKGKVLQQAAWEDLGIQGIKGEIKGFNAPTFMFMVSNLFRGQYHKNDGVNVQINNNVNNDVASLSDQELQDQIKQLTIKVEES